MRPSDENQAASTRPNLMSSRRGAGEENILAMLERDSARRSGARMSSSRLAWYCAAAAFSGILVGAVAWLAYDNHDTAGALQVQVQAERVAEEEVAAQPGPERHPPHVSAPAPEAPAAALIVDQPPAAPPPLVMLAPDGAAKARPAPAPKETAPVQAGTAPMEAKLPKTDRQPALAKADKANKTDKPAARVAKAPRPATAKAGAPARSRVKPVAPAPAEPGVDTDVALISAIIAHSERHRGERAQPAPCSGPTCPPPPSRP